jgi:alpha-tubulin suppressor-like RCC1 family protein
LSNVVFVSIGQRHTCAATLEGRVYCWGAGSRGQLGDGTTEEVRSSPALVKSLGLPARKVQCGKEHTCVELKDGTAQCWGSNELGELGDGTKNDRALPTKVEGVRGIRKLSVGGGQHACAALTNGEILCWGSNTHGQLGLAAGAPVTVPTRVQGLPAASKVYVGLDHSCALLPDATTQCWGANDHGQLGDGTTNPRATPAPVFGLAGIESLAVGWQVTCAAMTTGTVQCWGANDHGQLGIGSLGPSHATPTVVQGITHSSNELSVKGGNACTIAEDRTLRCWGWNDEGQLGDGTKEPRPAPVSITM